MTILEEYTNNIKLKGWNLFEFENELKRLIKEYNKLRNTNLIVYVSSFVPNLPCSLDRKDFFYFKDLLDGVEKGKDLDVYIETPGGDGTVAEEIVRYIRSEYKRISFVVCGEAKSAGTIMTMCADEILMTKTASLGPIDAQMISNRGVVSAFDYVEWMNEKKKEAEKNGRLNPADAVIIAQITPGEINGVEHSLEYAKDLVKQWLYKYKFKNWEVTETERKKVTDEMKKSRAKEIAEELSNHRKWRTHGKPLKIEDLENIGLRITHIDDDAKLKDVVYRINLVCRLIFNMSNNYKMFYTEKTSLSLSAQLQNGPVSFPGNPLPAIIDINHKCEKCGKEYVIYAKLINDPKLDEEMKKIGKLPFPKDNMFKCECGVTINLQGIRNEIEKQFGKKIV